MDKHWKIKTYIYSSINNFLYQFNPNKLTILEKWNIKRNIRKQKHRQNYPCSNQIVTCGFFGTSNQWANFISKSDYIYKNQHHIALRNNESWRFFNIGYNPNYIRRYKFYKLKVSKDIDREFFFQCIMPCCVLYCCKIDFI